jgi:phosphohistidine phosphatase
MVGHNPGFTHLFNHISDSFADNLPTCAVISLEFNCEWKKIGNKNGKLVFHEFPKDFRV